MKRHFHWLAIALAATLFVITHLVWLNDLPPRVATHFDAAGKANGWMTRTAHGTFMLCFGLGVPLFIPILCQVMRYLPPSLMNVPNPAYWRAPENYPKACDIMLRWAQWLAVGMLIWTTLLNRQMVLAHQVSPPRLATADTVGLTVGFLVMVGASMLWLIRRFQKAEVPSQPNSAD